MGKRSPTPNPTKDRRNRKRVRTDRRRQDIESSDSTSSSSSSSPSRNNKTLCRLPMPPGRVECTQKKYNLRNTLERRQHRKNLQHRNRTKKVYFSKAIRHFIVEFKESRDIELETQEMPMEAEKFKKELLRHLQTLNRQIKVWDLNRWIESNPWIMKPLEDEISEPKTAEELESAADSGLATDTDPETELGSSMTCRLMQTQGYKGGKDTQAKSFSNSDDRNLSTLEEVDEAQEVARSPRHTMTLYAGSPAVPFQMESVEPLQPEVGPELLPSTQNVSPPAADPNEHVNQETSNFASSSAEFVGYTFEDFMDSNVDVPTATVCYNANVEHSLQDLEYLMNEFLSLTNQPISTSETSNISDDDLPNELLDIRIDDILCDITGFAQNNANSSLATDSAKEMLDSVRVEVKKDPNSEFSYHPVSQNSAEHESDPAINSNSKIEADIENEAEIEDIWDYFGLFDSPNPNGKDPAPRTDCISIQTRSSKANLMDDKNFCSQLSSQSEDIHKAVVDDIPIAIPEENGQIGTSPARTYRTVLTIDIRQPQTEASWEIPYTLHFEPLGSLSDPSPEDHEVPEANQILNNEEQTHWPVQDTIVTENEEYFPDELDYYFGIFNNQRIATNDASPGASNTRTSTRRSSGAVTEAEISGSSSVLNNVSSASEANSIIFRRLAGAINNAASLFRIVHEENLFQSHGNPLQEFVRGMLRTYRSAIRRRQAGLPAENASDVAFIHIKVEPEIIDLSSSEDEDI